MNIPQTVIDPDAGVTADELIAPLVLLVHRYGLKTRSTSQGVDSPDRDTLKPAYLTFPHMDDAVEFLLQTAHLANYTIGDHLALSAHRPLGPNEGPTGMVRFLPEALPYLILLWTKILPKQ